MHISYLLEDGKGLKDKVRILEEENRKLQKAYNELKEILQNEIRRQAVQTKMNEKNVDELQKKFLNVDLNV